jgi:hypothetical protein
MFYVVFGMIVKVRNRIHDKIVSMLVYCYMNMCLMRKKKVQDDELSEIPSCHMENFLQRSIEEEEVDVAD